MPDVLTSRQLYAAFLRNLKEFAKKKGLENPNAIGQAANVAPNTIRGWVRLAPEAWPELGIRPGKGNYPQLDALEKVAGQLSVDVWQLLHPDPQRLQSDLAALQRYRDAEKPPPPAS